MEAIVRLLRIAESSERSELVAGTSIPRRLQYSCGSIFFYICSIASHRTLLLSLSMNLQQLKKLCRWMEWQHRQKEKR